MQPPPLLSIDEYCLFLDIDGTLLEFASSPADVEVDADLRTMLRRAAVATNGALALVSGRSLAQIDRLFEPVHWPAAGLHGLERRDRHGRVHRHAADRARIAFASFELEQLARLHPGVEIEDKGATVALHYRRVPALGVELEADVRALVERLGHGYHVQAGSCVLEIRPDGATKADAVDAFMGEAPFEGRRPLYAGDDQTDVAAFAAAERAGGVSVAVGPRVQARVGFAGVAEFRGFLERLVSG